MKISLMVAAALFGVAALHAPAATFYKLTDNAGRVTYADRAPSNFAGKVEVVAVNPDANSARLPGVVPSDVQVEAERIIRSPQVDRLTKGEVMSQRVERAQAELANARAALDQAQNNSPAEDWIYFTRGGRGPRPEYAARLESLEVSVKLAEANLAEAEQQQRLAY
ncbi:MAG: DUF4124 domain-containing protein [Usitatibacter sp.]